MSDAGNNFIRGIIQADVDAKTHDGAVITRFPPEPNGFLHIGHAKALCVDFGMASEFGGHCYLRMDDTNPSKEEQRYVDAIQADVRWLGFDWGENFSHASDYFERFYTSAEHLVRKGLAYVCFLSHEDMRTYRGTVNEAGRPSPTREASVEDNLAELHKMRSGEYPDGHCVLRAKISLDSSNMKMRDPPLYRIRHETHQTTGDAWCIYPMYDFAHPLSDALEGITHSICTLEFQDNRELYDWVVDNCPIPTWKPRQYEMARLKLGYTMMSKRRLLALVEEDIVDGWDDPRMPTLSGMRRLGVPAEALRDFVTRVGVAKADSLVDVALLEHCIRDALNEVSPRVMAVLDPLEVVVEGLEPGTREGSLWPHDIPREGTRVLPIGPRIYIEHADFSAAPPKGFRRLAAGATIRLRHGAVISCTGVEKDGDRVVRVLARVSQDKPRGTLHWVSADRAVKQTVRLYDRLFTSERPDAEEDFRDHINPDSLRVVEALVEPYIAAAPEGTRFQFERIGYFIKSDDGWNRTVGLKDGFKKKAAVATKKRKVRIERSYSVEDLAAAAAFEARGVGREEAVVLGTDEAMVRIYRDAVAHGVTPARAAKVVVHEVRVLARTAGSMDGGELAAVIKLVDGNTLSSSSGKQVLAALWSGSETPEAIVSRLGLAQNSDRDALGAIVDKLFADNPDKVEALRTNPRMMGFFVGGVMKATDGKANPQLVNQLVRSRLD